MSDYSTIYNTNTFRVTDEEKYNELVKKLIYTEKSTSENSNGIYHQLSGYDGICYDLTEEGDCEGDEYSFMNELCKILPKDEAAIYTEIGHTGTDVNAYSLVATCNGVTYIGLDEVAKETAKKEINKAVNKSVER